MSSNANNGAARTGGAAPLAGAAAAIRRYRWLICSLLFLATTVNYVDRQILALFKEFLDNELGWTNEQFGLVNAAFQGAYASRPARLRRLIDRVGTKIGYAVSIATWSLAAMAHALVGIGRRVLRRARSRSASARAGTSPRRSRRSPCGSRSRAGLRDRALQLRHERGRDRRAGGRPGYRPDPRLALGVRSGRRRRVPLAVPLAPVLRCSREAAEGLDGRVRPTSAATRTTGAAGGVPIAWRRALGHPADLVVHRRRSS